MAFTWSRLRFYYAFLAVYLVFQVIFLNVLKSYNQDTHTNAFKILEIYKKLSDKLNKESQLDNGGLYKFVQLKEMESQEPFDVAVISQCSSNHFSSIESLFSVWEGPISIAVYSGVDNIEKSLWDVARFVHCYNWRDFAMQLVVPAQDVYVKDYKFAYGFLSDVDKSVSCSLPYVSSSNSRKNYNWTSPYPINLLRNVAKSGTSTDYILVIDIDMIPSPNLREGFLTFATARRSNPAKIAYVIPVFEILPDVAIPVDKTGLLKMVEENRARPFYIVPCENCQKLTKYDEWLESEFSTDVRALYQVKWKHPWEPFVITKRHAPNFDERFKQYGMNRVSQGDIQYLNMKSDLAYSKKQTPFPLENSVICELHVAGYKFVVLNNVFLIHMGFKSLEDFHETKDKEMETNRRVYGRFKIEIRYKYPESERSC